MQTASVATTPPPAVPRKSRRRWYILGFVLVVLATPIAWYLAAGWIGDREIQAVYAELDAEDPDWRWPDMVGKLEPIPADENSAEQILKVSAMTKSPVAFTPGPKWDRNSWLSNVRLSKHQVDAANVAFKRCDPTLRDEARKLKDMPRGRHKIPIEDNPFAMDFSEVQRSREVCNLLMIDAAMRAQEGDLDGAAESCQAIVNTAASFHKHPILIGFLVRVAEQAIAVASIERTLGQGAVSEPQLKKLQESLQREADDNGFVDAMRGERAFTQQLYENIRSGKVTLSQIMGNASTIGNANRSTMDSLLDMFPNVVLKNYPNYLRGMNERVKACKLDPAERDEKLFAMELEVRKNGDILTRLIAPAVQKVSHASVRGQASLRCATVAIAAERYRLDHGAWPSKLDDLVKDGLLAKIPNDPYDGKPLRWKRTATGLIIYSVSLDKVDNGGNLFRANPMAEGTDLGFELFDPKLRGVPAPVED